MCNIVTLYSYKDILQLQLLFGHLYKLEDYNHVRSNCGKVVRIMRGNRNAAKKVLCGRR